MVVQKRVRGLRIFSIHVWMEALFVFSNCSFLKQLIDMAHRLCMQIWHRGTAFLSHKKEGDIVRRGRPLEACCDIAATGRYSRC